MDIYGVMMLVSAYLIGSISPGYRVVKKLKNIDIRTTGSGATGATNVNRQLGKTWGRIILILDLLKGFLVTTLALIFFRHNPWIVGSAISLVVLGHAYPVFLKFKGGKGVATFLGVLLPVLVLCFEEFPHPWTYGAILGVTACWLTVHKLRKKMGLSSLFLMSLIIIYFGGLTIFTGFSVYSYLTLVITAIALFIMYKHRENWIRLWKRQEPETDLL